MPEKIIFIGGIFTGKHKKTIYNNFLKVLEKKYEIFFMKENYFYSESEKILKIQKNILEEIKKTPKTQKIILIGYSFGGIILGGINLKDFGNIKKVLFIGSPIGLNLFFLKTFLKAKKILKFSEDNFLKEKTFSIGFYFDLVVPFIFTKLSFSKHKNYPFFHVFFYIKKFSNKIINDFLKSSG